MDFNADELKNNIQCGSIDVTNLSITADNRLISIKDKKLAKDAIRYDDIRRNGSSNPAYVRYQGIFDALDIKIVTLMYFKSPKDGDTLETIMMNNFNCSGRQFNNLFIKPEVFAKSMAGRINSEEESKDNNKIKLVGSETKVNNILLVLNKDDSFKIVLLSELSLLLQ